MIIHVEKGVQAVLAQSAAGCAAASAAFFCAYIAAAFRLRIVSEASISNTFRHYHVARDREDWAHRPCYTAGLLRVAHAAYAGC